jgi:hypothetical protein
MNSYPYRIRLRGPWEAEPLDPPGERRRVTIPAQFGECGLSGCRRVRFRRRFGRPRQLDECERVWLVGEGLSGRADLQLNGMVIGQIEGGAFAFPVVRPLDERNELIVNVTADGDGGLWGDVALEIRCPAYLDNVRIEPANGGWRVVGEVAGEAEAPLDVYVLTGGRTIGYAACAGGRFEIVTEEIEMSPETMRVELVNGSVVWYVAEVSR